MTARIEDYGPIGDLHTMALVGRNGSIDWLCLPHFDSGACFAALLGDEEAGFWRLAPTRAVSSTKSTHGTQSAQSPESSQCTRRRYLEDSLILETEWVTPDGTVRVLDFMPPRDGAADIVRIVQGVSGRVPMTMEMRLRFDYGRDVPWVQQQDGRLWAIAGPDAVWLDTPVPLIGVEMSTMAEFEVAEGERVPFVLTYHRSHLQPPARRDVERHLAKTRRFWSEWLSHLTYQGEWADAVRRSLITLKALTYEPTGGVLAAATTSLPEQLGGPRNWDYRYCWLRDATFTLEALLETGFVNEASAWRDWLLRAAAGDPADLQIMYSIDGTRRIPEYTVPWLAGYEGSTPVRVGNAAAGQFQLDVWGEVLDGLHLARVSGLRAGAPAWELQKALLDFLEGHWRDPDNSLWEVRGPRRHFVHSKVMAWAGVDRAVQAVERFGLDGPADRWRALRAEIHAEVCDRGYHPERGSFRQFYGSDGLDAALLLIPRVGFLPWSDPRVVGTVEAVQRELVEDGLVRRYLPENDGRVDGLPGDEGAFLACSFWLADALHGIGRREQARGLFERLLALRNDLGILSEEYDVRLGRQLGNTPQAFSHVGLVNTARQLSGA